MSFINVYDVCEFVEGKEFDKIKNICKFNDICVKYDNPKNLYLLANINEHQNKFVNKNKNVKPEVISLKDDCVEGDEGVCNQELEGDGQGSNGPESINEDKKQKSEVKIELSEDEKNINNFERFKKQANGIIFEKETNKIVSMCQNKLQDLNSVEEFYDLINSNNDTKIRLEYCEDGTMMRLYNYNNVWYTATTRCIDAKSSFWTSSKNFDTLFWEIFDKSLLSSLDKNYTYVFILLHKENRIVIKHNVNMLVYISRINNVSFEEDYTNLFYNIYGIRRPKVIEASNLSEAFCNKYKRGIIIKVLDKTINVWNIYKLDFDKYKSIKTVRGNVPELRMRYLELLRNPDDLKLFEMFYGENKYMFNFIRISIIKMIKEVHKLYIDSHIKHCIEVKEGNMFYRTLRQLHAQYKITNKPISFEDVQNKIYSLDKNIIKKFLNWN